MASKFHIGRVRRERYWELRLAGCFDGTSAWELRRAMARLGRRLPIVVDFRDVTELHEFGAATLAAGFLARRWPPIQFARVQPAHRELLRQYGLDLDLPFDPNPRPHPVLGLLEPVSS